MMVKKVSLAKIFLLIILISIIFISGEARGVKNIIFMVPDGMTLSNVTATRIYAFGIGQKRLYLETLDQIGYQTTHSLNSMVTDSAAAASAWACGEKFNNGEISYHSETGVSPKTILELARELGKKSGLVATSTITHATPAVFAAHVANRNWQSEIGRQYISEKDVNVILGGGLNIFQTKMKSDKHSHPVELIQQAKENGYTVVLTKKELVNSKKSAKLLGLFNRSALTPSYRKGEVKNADQEPSLAEMTSVALEILERNPRGFFLLVEGSQIDWANHANNLEYQISEILEFDRAVKVVLDWVNQKKPRKENTLIIIVSDHGCGGFAIKGPMGKTLTQPGQIVNEGWIWGSHTGEDTIIWSQGPYSRHLGKAIDNTDIFHIMKAALYGKKYQKQ
ncbi:MAG: alkaline phosphatase [Candidatus Aminicenantes bacterium]|nr:alkaline phosphatase [Candidatus Aminicenantes bacterium]